MSRSPSVRPRIGPFGHASGFLAAVRHFHCKPGREATECSEPTGSSAMAKPRLTIMSKNYGSWSLRGWLLCKMAALDFDEELLPSDDPSNRAELLLLSPSFLVPCLTNGAVKVWDTLAIAEYLHETKPDAALLPKDAAARAHCRAISGEMHSGFANLRSALPMNLRAHYQIGR